MSEHQHAKTLKTTDNTTKQNAHINGPVSQYTHPAAIIQQGSESTNIAERSTCATTPAYDRQPGCSTIDI